MTTLDTKEKRERAGRDIRAFRDSMGGAEMRVKMDNEIRIALEYLGNMTGGANGTFEAGKALQESAKAALVKKFYKWMDEIEADGRKAANERD